MKPSFLIAAFSIAAFGGAGAQTFVLDSPIIITSTIRTQGGDVVKTREETTVTVKQLKFERYHNKDILAELLKRGLITESTSGWSLAYLSDETGAGGVYAKKAGAAPVAVPADLLTLPVFGPTITTGRETTGPRGTSYDGLTDVSAATLSVKGIPVSGIATNGIRTLSATLQGTTYQLDTVRTTMTFTGGAAGDTGAALVDGAIVIGGAKLSTLATLP